ncbi:MAG: SDR family NAD(P)-dependent oxidoreductase [Phycisphaerales bacterium]|nr:MAG: SDR family NAD(P)-dependent oxidoreductase [Phycisphaerales bacterium]
MGDSRPNVVVLAMDKVGHATAVELSSSCKISLLDCSDHSEYRVVRCEQGRGNTIESRESTDLARTEAALTTFFEETPGCDALVVIAGAPEQDDWLGQVSAFQESFSREFFLPLVAVKAALARMTAAGTGRIVMVLPRSGLFADDRHASASCAHWALRRVCQSLRAEAEASHIGVHLTFAPERRPNGSPATTFSAYEIKELAANLARLLEAHGDDVTGVCTYDRLLYVKRQLFPNGGKAPIQRDRNTASEKRGERARPRSALITGASSGLGRELARRYASHVDVLHLVARNTPALEELRRELTTSGRCDVRLANVDLADPVATAHYAAQLECTDALVNCAGFSVVGPIAQIPLEWFKKNMAVNFLAPVILTYAALNGQNKPRHIVNVLSTTAVAGRKGHGCYSATKAALWAFTQMLRGAVPAEVHVLEAIPATFTSDFARNTVKVAAGRGEPRAEQAGQDTRHGVTSAMVAERIESALGRGDKRVYVPFNARLFLSLEALVPALFRRLFQ